VAPQQKGNASLQEGTREENTIPTTSLNLMNNSFKPLSDELMKELLGPVEVAERVAQVGPVRWFDKEMRCASKRCTSPTYIKVVGIPHCYTHALRKVNEMYVELEGEVNGNSSS